MENTPELSLTKMMPRPFRVAKHVRLDLGAREEQCLELNGFVMCPRHVSMLWINLP
jgi:hypothetical protein